MTYSLGKKISIGILFFSFLPTIFAVYSIKNSSINNFGSEISQSVNYKIFDTGGQFVSGPIDGTNFSINSGYQQQSGGEISISCGSLNLDGIQFSGKSKLENNFVDCNIKSTDSSGYVFAINSKSSQLINQEDSQYKIESITNTEPDFWPETLTNGTGWGIHLGIGSDNFDSSVWGDLDNYQTEATSGSVSGKWVGISENTSFNLISKNSITSETGDNEKVYFGFEVDENTILPSGEYQTEIYFTALPTF